MKKIAGGIPFASPPEWAVLERWLIDLMNTTPELVLDRYTCPDGSLLWPSQKDFHSVDGLDDMYESFHNWPLFYLAGGDEKFLRLAQREFDAITEQASHLDTGHGHPMAVREYEQGYDWMHQGEGYTLFYYLNLADPGNRRNKERSLRYAGFYIGEDPEADNYDREKRLMRCCYLGSMGPAYRNFSGQPWTMAPWKNWYGLPYHDLEGIATLKDIFDPEKAQRMGNAMKERLTHSDTPINLLCTTLVMNAYLHTGDEKYKRFISEYADAWRERTEQNGGLVPDNVGPDGRIGQCMKDGHWYGGYYGWTWPHGFYFIADALTITGENELLLTGRTDRMDWMRSQYGQIEKQAVYQDGTEFVPMKYSDPGAVHEYYGGTRFLTMEGKVTDDPTYVRLLERNGWYEFMPLPPQQPTHLWFATQRKDDLALIERTHDNRVTDWKCVNDFYGVHKNQGGRDYAWVEYLQGRFPEYPKLILQHNIKQVYERLKMIREDTQDPSTYSDSYLQARNPVNMEGLIELTMGGPLPIYNGGHLLVSLRWFDEERRRPGLPEDVAALVSRVDEAGVTVTLVNLNGIQSRSLQMLAGAFGEHEIQEVNGEKAGGNRLQLELAPASEMTLSLKLGRYQNDPRYIAPFANDTVSMKGEGNA